MVDTAKTMGVALLVFGVAVAGYTGSTGEPALAAAGVAAGALLLYMGIGLYSRSHTGEERLHAAEEDSRRELLEGTASYVAAAAAAVAFIGFAAASVTSAGLIAHLVFAGVFLYSLASLAWLRGEEADGSMDGDDEIVEEADGSMDGDDEIVEEADGSMDGDDEIVEEDEDSRDGDDDSVDEEASVTVED